jgi:ribosomal-protein-alanine N-acetyltransferase
MNSDPEVMRFFPRMLDFEQTKSMVESIESKFDIDDFGLWAIEIKETGEFIGFTGLNRPNFQAHFMPCVEVGWRIARSHWGRGYAPEAAVKAMEDGFNRVGLSEIVSFTAAINRKSIRVMEKLEMKTCSEENFLHPVIPDGNPLQLHVLYKAERSAWLKWAARAAH